MTPTASEAPADSRSDAALLAALLGTTRTAPENEAAAARLLAHLGGLPGLALASESDLVLAGGLDSAQAAALSAACELARRLNAAARPEKAVIRNAEEAARLVGDMAALPQEHVRLILLDTHNQVVATPTLYIGTLHGTLIRVAEVFREVMIRNCPAFILAHNHPAGDASPSPEDVELTRTLVAAAKLLDIQLLDHLILSPSGWQSLKQQGLGF